MVDKCIIFKDYCIQPSYFALTRYYKKKTFLVNKFTQWYLVKLFAHKIHNLLLKYSLYFSFTLTFCLIWSMYTIFCQNKLIFTINKSVWNYKLFAYTSLIKVISVQEILVWVCIIWHYYLIINVLVITKLFWIRAEFITCTIYFGIFISVYY